MNTQKRILIGILLMILNIIKLITGYEICVNDEIIYGLADIIYVGWVAWKNNDFTPISAKMTNIMRVAKKMAKTGDLTLIDAIENAVKEWEEQYDHKQ